MTGHKGNSEFCFPETLNVPRGEAEGNIGRGEHSGRGETKLTLSLHDALPIYEKETACRTHFHMKGFALRLVLKQRHMRTRKWPIDLIA